MKWAVVALNAASVAVSYAMFMAMLPEERITPIRQEIFDMGFSETLAPYLSEGKSDSHLNFNETIGGGLERLLSDAQAAGHDVSIYSGYRSLEHQERLWNDALERYGSPEAARRWVAPPGNSQHNHGNAADLRYGSDDAQAWVHANAGNYGLHFRMDHEPWHIEPNPEAPAFTETADENHDDHSHTITVAELSEQTNEEHRDRAGSVETTENREASAAMSEAAHDERTSQTEQAEEDTSQYTQARPVNETVTGPINNRLHSQLDNIARNFLSMLTPQQKMIEQAQYAKAKRYSGESGSFDDWFKTQRFNGYLQAFHSGERDALGELSPQQEQLLSNAKMVTDELPTYSSSVMGLV